MGCDYREKMLGSLSKDTQCHVSQGTMGTTAAFCRACPPGGSNQLASRGGATPLPCS